MMKILICKHENWKAEAQIPESSETNNQIFSKLIGDYARVITKITIT